MDPDPADRRAAVLVPRKTAGDFAVTAAGAGAGVHFDIGHGFLLSRGVGREKGQQQNIAIWGYGYMNGRLYDPGGVIEFGRNIYFATQ